MMICQCEAGSTAVELGSRNQIKKPANPAGFLLIYSPSKNRLKYSNRPDMTPKFPPVGIGARQLCW
jgi:hypothetical protein